MAISERTRKTLWGRAGGRCSMCRRLLITSATESDSPSVIGQEAHIVAQSPGGPRSAELAELDSYDNLILLCSIDHKRIDDQRTFYTVEFLRAAKAVHEAWVQSQGETVHDGRLLVAPAHIAPTPALTLSLNIQLSPDAMFYCALALVVVVALAAMTYQARSA